MYLVLNTRPAKGVRGETYMYSQRIAMVLQKRVVEMPK